MHKLGVMVDNLGPNQLAFYLINYGNKMTMEDNKELIVFYSNPQSPCLNIGFPIMQISEAWSYNGPLIATNFNLASQLIKFTGTPHKYFYVWDLEWLRMPNKQFQVLVDVYRNPRLKLIARSEEHARVINSCWNTEVVGVVDNFNVEKIYDIIK